MSVATRMPASRTHPPSQTTPDEEVKLFAELLSVTTHDLRSPLGAIGIFCELLLTSDKPLDESQVRSVEMIAEAATKAQRILEDASEVSRAYRRTLTLARETVDLRGAVDEALAQVRSRAEARQVRLETRFAPGRYTVLADPARLAQILLRLAEEAVAVCPRDSAVTVSGEVSGAGAVTVSLSHPAGNAAEEPVKREPDTSLKGRLANRNPGESHYSLHLAARVAELMGGSLDYSTGPGFRATLSFPAAGSGGDPR